MSRTIAIIPARAGSKGIPKKNLCNLCGKPLVEWTIEFALKSTLIDKTIVTTDDQQIADISTDLGAYVPYLRPDYLSTDTAKTSDVIIDLINNELLSDNDILVLLEPTSPFRTKSDFQLIHSILTGQKCRKAVSVSEAKSEAYQFQLNRNDISPGMLSPLLDLHLPNDLRRQDIQPTFYLDGTFYLSYVRSFRESPGFLGDSTGSIISHPFSKYEIDCPADIDLYEAIIKHAYANQW
ncbi:CMP-N,N'-diacetyllegionaminic acid synthase [Prochlorococcus marinus str. MIT 1313]|uniref:acylneuraminate cytidylyltransferase family protein n=1 Tax=Prochlorococcus TaxID=1218 RepID=UPI0007B3A649|nr:acylneuraminate cytidylyltransferase family protein [Prochlorococcus marinus]KZR69974.1 CMP-N,N'-diacetyllegionaminic acid synthase [Prochlorococcus marinus str. MIT 1313]KZR72322.1 CMP-N,N'-diacetyllegionaminic acid synthase [Prochlorococcus marinus str. MIT 1318]